MKNTGPAAAHLDFNQRPLVAIWEVTQACDLACRHCRASAQPLRHRRELSTQEAEALIDQVAALRVPIFVFTGGDPLKRPDIFHLVGYATRQGVHASLSPSATPLLTRSAIAEFKQRGLVRLALSLDGSTAATHDSFRGVAGSFEHTLQAVAWARELRLPVQINTTITRHNWEQVDDILLLLEGLRIVLWSAFFLVPTGRGQMADLISAPEFEHVFARLHDASRRVPFHIKTTEGQHYRRFVLQQRAAERLQIPATGQIPASAGLRAAVAEELGRARQGVSEAKGFVFISHTGDVCPSGFLPLPAGNVRSQSLAEIYQKSPWFVALRDTSRLGGKCGACEFHDLCGGSRARAFAVHGDAFSEEPCCVYQPA